MLVLRTRTFCVNFPCLDWSFRTVLHPPVRLGTTLTWKLSTGSQSPKQALSIRTAGTSRSIKAMSEQQYQVLQPVKVTSTSLKTYTGDLILSDCFTVASVTEKDSDGVVLGLTSNEGPIALQDFTLGEVKHM